MNPTMTHQEIVELLPAAALETLAPEDLEQVLAHVRECDNCARLLDEYRAVVVAVALELPGDTMDPGRSRRIRERLLARVRTTPSGISKGRSRWGNPEGWAGWAVAAGLAGVLLVHHGFHRPLAYGWIVAGIATLALVGFGVYAMIQRRQVSALEARLAELDGGNRDR